MAKKRRRRSPHECQTASRSHIGVMRIWQPCPKGTPLRIVSRMPPRVPSDEFARSLYGVGLHSGWGFFCGAGQVDTERKNLTEAYYRAYPPKAENLTACVCGERLDTRTPHEGESDTHLPSTRHAGASTRHAEARGRAGVGLDTLADRRSHAPATEPQSLLPAA